MLRSQDSATTTPPTRADKQSHLAKHPIPPATPLASRVEPHSRLYRNAAFFAGAYYYHFAILSAIFLDSSRRNPTPTDPNPTVGFGTSLHNNTRHIDPKYYGTVWFTVGLTSARC